MALPTAQLGSMASLNVPSYIPSQVVRKEPKLWQTALAQLLTQAAGQTIGQGVQNSMSRDYAPEFGMEKAGAVEKFFSGPRANEKFTAMKAQADTASKLEDKRFANERDNQVFSANTNLMREQEGRKHDIELATMRQRGSNAEMTQRGDIARREMELRAQLAEWQNMMDEARALEAGTRDINQSNERREASQRTGAVDLLQKKADLEKTMEQIRSQKQLREMMEGAGKKPQTASVNPNIVAARNKEKLASMPATPSVPISSVNPGVGERNMLELFERLQGGPLTAEGMLPAPAEAQSALSNGTGNTFAAPNAVSPQEMFLLLLNAQQNQAR